MLLQSLRNVILYYHLVQQLESHHKTIVQDTLKVNCPNIWIDRDGTMTQPQRNLDLTMSDLIYEEEVNSTTEVIKIKLLNVAHLRTRIRPAIPTVTRNMLYNL